MAEAILLSHLERLISELDRDIQTSKSRSMVQTIAFFDLSASTTLKLLKGHSAGTDAALRFTMAASKIVADCDGTVVKELGDGILCRFDDPLDACRAALNTKTASYRLGLLCSCGITIGRVTRYEKPSGLEDVLGDAVDRCSRVQSLAYPGQVLIDRPLHEVVRSHLMDLPEVMIGERFQADAKGVGRLELWEISLQLDGLVDRILTPFRVHAGGRLAIEEKIQFIDHAESDVIEVGTGLTSFAKYFTGQKPGEFKDPVRRLLRRGVTVRCYALDPDHAAGMAYLHEQGDEDYEEEMERAKRMILAERRQCISLAYPGRLEYYLYRRIPEFHAMCVDGSDPLNARILFSPYMLGSTRSEHPVYQVSRIADPELYDKYWKSILAIQASSTEVRS